MISSAFPNTSRCAAERLDGAGCINRRPDRSGPPAAGFIVPEHYDYFYPYYASLLENFAPEARAVPGSKTGSVFGDQLRTAAPIGGTHMQDLPGTAQVCTRFA